MRTVRRISATVLAVTALVAAPLHAQTQVSFGVGTGGLFAGVGFGFGAYHDTGSLFVGMSFGDYVSPYAYDGWGYGYWGARRYHYSGSYCGGYYWDPYWDPWGDWYGSCALYRPYFHSAYRYRRYYVPTSYVYVSATFGSPWGPYWAYDPWNSYWTGYWDGRRWGLWDGYYGSRTRLVYASSGRFGSTIYRPSPLSRYGPTYKESPVRSVGRSATRRSLTPTPAAAPTRVAGVDRGSGARSTTSRSAISRMPPSARTATSAPSSRASTGRSVSPSTRPSAGARSAAPSTRPSAIRGPAPGARATARPSDRVRGSDRPTAARSGATRSAPSASRSPGTRSSPTTGRATPSDAVRSQTRDRSTGPSAQPSRPSRPSDAMSRPSAPSTRNAPSRPSGPSARSAPSRPSGPSTRSAPSRPSGPSARSAPSRPSGPSPRSAPSRPSGPSAQSAPSRPSGPSARSAPSRPSGPSTRSAPSRPSGPSTRSAPSRSSGPSARSAPSGRSSAPSSRGSSRR